MHWTQVIIGTALAAYLGSFLVTAAMARRAGGGSSLGNTGGNLIGPLLSLLASAMLLLTAGAYVLDAHSLAMFGHIVLLSHPIVRLLGVIALVVATVLLVWAEASIGSSFRVALPGTKQPLVTDGVYGIIRNPMALSVDLVALGVLFLAPSYLALASLVLNVIGYEWKVRVEEEYLRHAHGALYDSYCARTGRYLPRLF